MMRHIFRAGLVAAGLAMTAPAGGAQTVAAGSMVAVPAEPGGWALQIFTRGGIMGRGAGEIIMLSDGRLTCRQPDGKCAPAATAGALRSLREQVRLASTEAWQSLPPGTMCSDCLITELALTTRNGDGTLSTLRASWDPTTRGKLPAAIVRVHDLVSQLAQPLTR